MQGHREENTGDRRGHMWVRNWKKGGEQGLYPWLGHGVGFCSADPHVYGGERTYMSTGENELGFYLGFKLGVVRVGAACPARSSANFGRVNTEILIA